jgi:hypothetical protein
VSLTAASVSLLLKNCFVRTFFKTGGIQNQLGGGVCNYGVVAGVVYFWYFLIIRVFFGAFRLGQANLDGGVAGSINVRLLANYFET